MTQPRISYEDAYWIRHDGFERCVSALLSFNYTDSDGVRTKRDFDVRSFVRGDNACYLIGYCHLRNATRRLSSNAITNPYDRLTGEPIPNLLEFMETKYKETPDYNIDTFLDTHYNSISILIYISAADGAIRKPEREVIIDFCCRKSDSTNVGIERLTSMVQDLCRNNRPVRHEFYELVELHIGQPAEIIEPLIEASDKILYLNKDKSAEQRRAVKYVRRKLSNTIEANMVKNIFTSLNLDTLQIALPDNELRDYKDYLARECLDIFTKALVLDSYQIESDHGVKTPFNYGMPHEYNGNAEKIFFYLVVVEGELPWQRQVANPNFIEGIYSGESRWTRIDDGTKYISCLKAGVTKYQDPIKRSPKYYKSTLHCIELSKSIGILVEGVFWSRVDRLYSSCIRKVGKGNWSSYDWEGIRVSFGGSSEMFNFDADIKYLTDQMDKSAEISTRLFELGGENIFEQITTAFHKLLTVIFFIVKQQLIRLAGDRFPLFLKNTDLNERELQLIAGLQTGDELFQWALTNYWKVTDRQNINPAINDVLYDIVYKEGFGELFSDSFVLQIIDEAVANCEVIRGRHCLLQSELDRKRLIASYGTENPLKFIFTGEFNLFTREEALMHVAKIRGVVVGSVDAKTDYVVVGSDPGSIACKATELGVAMLDENQFLELVGRFTADTPDH